MSLATNQGRRLVDEHAEDLESAGYDASESHDDSKIPLILQEVLVHKGETVTAGTTLGALADYSELYIEGSRF